MVHKRKAKDRPAGIESHHTYLWETPLLWSSEKRDIIMQKTPQREGDKPLISEVQGHLLCSRFFISRSDLDLLRHLGPTSTRHLTSRPQHQCYNAPAPNWETPSLWPRPHVGSARVSWTTAAQTSSHSRPEVPCSGSHPPLKSGFPSRSRVSPKRWKCRSRERFWNK